MALVYEARRESLAGVSPRVAIKLILPDFAGSDQFQELFINEARLGASMQHQNLVQIQDFDRDGEKFFLVMEYVEGLTLRRVVSLCARHNIAVPMGVIAEIGRQACDGLHYAHAACDEHGNHLGLVHRDVKPANVILNPQGVIKVLDFGISKGRLLRERKGAVKGTWGYMAPEQAVGLDIGPSADVFGLGTVLYEIASQRSLFDQKPPDEIKRLLADDHAARMATQLDPAYGPLVSVLVRALQRDPRARYQTAADLGRALSALLPDPITARDEVVRFYQVLDALYRGRPVPAGRMAGGTSPGVVSQGTIGPPSQPPERGSAFVGVVAGVVTLCLLVGAAVAAAIWTTTGLDLVPAALRGDPSVERSLAADEPPGPNGAGAPGEARAVPPALRGTTAGARLPPSGSVRSASNPGAVAALNELPAELEEVKVVVVRRPAEAPTAVAPVAPSPEIAPSGAPGGAVVAMGLLTVSAAPGSFEVYMDGALMNKGPLSRQEIPAGSHTIMIIADDGRRISFPVTVEPDREVRKNWDFDRSEWRR
jgi:serine/threonine-protein kinase